MGIRPQPQPIPTSQIPQDGLDQTELIHQDDRKNGMQACIKYKADYDRKANASKLKESVYVYVLQPKADHQWSKFHLQNFGGLARTVLPNNNYLVRKIGTNKTQVLHCNRMRQFTPRLTPDDIRITPQEYKPDPDVSLKHDYLYARAWECDYQQPIFDAEKNIVTPPKSIPVQSDISTEEMMKTQGTAHECSPEIFPPTEELCDVTDTYPEVEPDVETSSEQPSSSPTDPRSFQYNLRHNPKPNCNDDCRY